MLSNVWIVVENSKCLIVLRDPMSNNLNLSCKVHRYIQDELVVVCDQLRLLVLQVSNITSKSTVSM